MEGLKLLSKFGRPATWRVQSWVLPLLGAFTNSWTWTGGLFHQDLSVFVV